MKTMILSDLIVMRRNLIQLFLTCLIITIVITLAMNNTLAVVGGCFGAMIPLLYLFSIAAYDEMNEWQTYRLTLPTTRKDSMIGRYAMGDYIFGYSVANVVSARDVQYRHKQNFLGKSLDTFFAMGPVIVTADEFPCPPALPIRSFVNGELRQNSVTDQVFFNIRHIVSELSQGMTLPAGTILITGTPAGVGMGMDPPCFLKRGDVVTCEIDGIGRISNPIR